MSALTSGARGGPLARASCPQTREWTVAQTGQSPPVGRGHVAVTHMCTDAGVAGRDCVWSATNRWPVSEHRLGSKRGQWDWVFSCESVKLHR